ncbi:hypothetical protein [Rhodopirellula bahusiensis]|uniref:hypothetical protein n=1 Tax=Rhodopirellula bahusiensis TaxID=2014065 RepID=UPI0032642A6C
MALARFRLLGNRRSFSHLESHRLGNPPQVDASFYCKRLRKTAALAILLGMVNILSGVPSSMKASNDTSRSNATASEQAPDRNQVKVRVLDESSNHSIEANQPLISSGPRAVPPFGWRRTANGWENVAEWPDAHNQTGGIPAQVSLSDQILLQEKREPVVLRRSMDRLRHTHPAVIASIQIASVLVLFATWIAVREKPLRNTDSETPSQLAS